MLYTTSRMVFAWSKMTKQEAAKEDDKEDFNNDRHEDVQLPGRVNTHRVDFLEMSEKFKSIRNEPIACINESKHRIDLLNDAFRLSDSAPIPSNSYSRVVCRCRDRPSAHPKRYLTRKLQIGSTWRVFSRERWFTPLSSQIPWTKLRNDSHIVSILPHGRVLRQLRRYDNLPIMHDNFGYKQIKIGRARRVQDCIHVWKWPVCLLECYSCRWALQ